MSSIETLRNQILAQIKSNPQATTNLSDNLDKSSWYLLGTQGCHLCDQAETLLQQFGSVHPIHIQYIDITDLDTQLMDSFADIIPVILIPSVQINYPFSLVDLQRIYH